MLIHVEAVEWVENLMWWPSLMLDFGKRAIHILIRPKLLCNDWLQITFSYIFDASTSSPVQSALS